MTTVGNNPKLTTSASESSSFPIGELTFSSRATNPSKKSNTPASHTKYAAGMSRPSRTKTTPKQPQIRLQHVKKFGKCRFMIKGFSLPVNAVDGAERVCFFLIPDCCLRTVSWIYLHFIG